MLLGINRITYKKGIQAQHKKKDQDGFKHVLSEKTNELADQYRQKYLSNGGDESAPEKKDIVDILLDPNQK